MAMFPLVSWDMIDGADADARLVAWGHWLGGCDRPFGRQDYGLFLGGDIVSVAVSASTAGTRCADYARYEVVELARLCSHPGHRDMTRVALRLWRKCAAADWAKWYWPVVAYVSYANAVRHSGDIYRFDGWKKAKDVKGGVATHGHQAGTAFDPKSVWVYDLDVPPEVRDGWSKARTDAVESAREAEGLRLSRGRKGDAEGGDALPLFADRDA